MTESEIDWAAMSGEGDYRIPRLTALNEVSLNGDGEAVEVTPGNWERKGGFFRKRVLLGNRARDEKPEEINLGKEISVVFLKIRRKMVERADKGEIVQYTNEHDNRYSDVTLVDKRTGQAFSGKANDLWERNKGLRTTQVLYALLLTPTSEPELVRLMVRGSSLGSDAKAPEVLSFYRYIESIPKGTHMWQYVTKLTPALEKGEKTYFAMDFHLGETLDPAMVSLAQSRLKEVYENCLEVEAARKAKVLAAGEAKPAEAAQQAAAGASDGMAAFDAVIDTGTDAGIEYPKEDINPDDIPF